MICCLVANPIPVPASRESTKIDTLSAIPRLMARANSWACKLVVIACTNPVKFDTLMPESTGVVRNKFII